jgi:toxin ParE1/3/4
VSRKPVVLRARAQLDIDEAAGHLLSEAGPAVSLAFIDALEQAHRHLGEYPGSGSPRYAQEVDLPGLRSWLVREFPYLIFYIERETAIDVWRVLHASRDVPPWLQEPRED